MIEIEIFSGIDIQSDLNTAVVNQNTVIKLPFQYVNKSL
jgi:hypothetical protein